MTAALNRFISRSADRCRSFFQLLHKWKGFEWTEECNLAFEGLKEYLSQPPILSRPEGEEVLFTYIAVTCHALSLVLVRMEAGLVDTDLLCKQIFAGGRDPLFATGEGHFCCNACNKKAPSLLPSAYYDGSHSTSFTNNHYFGGLII